MEKTLTTYAGWKAAAIKADHHQQLVTHLKAERRSNLPTPTQKPFVCPPPPPQFPLVDKRDATGITFGGMGQPMEQTINSFRRNGACFFCDVKGHFARNCPQKKSAVRAMVMALNPEERALFADELHGMKESSFETTDAQGSETNEEEDVSGFRKDQE